MAEKKLYLGSVGPFLYEDDEAIDDADGDFSGELRRALVTNGQLYIEEAPSDDYDVARYVDLLAEKLFKRHTLESEEDLIINNNEQKLNFGTFIIEGLGSLTINGSGELCVIGA